ncbi:MlaC/ttg2D family ABC transporter substrate-binding protein [Paracoccus aminophilus]|uniref:Toluene tolerance family protein n=1 Tax=Paracoccus aminophilus JCM 7686 TaxID=1367847 RepID=S5XRC9_PARAH|nr:ABC transporter substrate-binding protein [Paracoccus aminophilus]AGT07617.1 toluene tolerance family protein [Paracoccus aminophilus JCM 7686]
MPIETRRGFLGMLGAAVAVSLTPLRPAYAMNAAQAQAMIQTAVDAVFKVINSGHAPAQMYQEFEQVFARYADVEVIARSALGPAGRGVTGAAFADYKRAFQGYIGRKYGKRFREFVGSKIEVGAARPLKSFYAVSSTAYLNGRAPMEVEWHVSDKSGQVRFFNMIIEGINMLASERAEIAAMLAKRKGDLAGLTEDLRKAG